LQPKLNMNIAPPQPMPQTIDEVIQALETIITDCISRKDRLGYFAALYHQVTVRVKEGIEKNEFEDGKRMEKLDVIFANRYLTAVQQFRQQQAASSCWLAAFNRTRKGNTLVLQHLLAGMNAHINLDLGIAAVETVAGGDIHAIRKDFNQINMIIASLVFEVLNELNRVSPLLSLFGLHATNDSILIQFSVSNARDGAWSFAEELSSKISEAEKKDCMQKRDMTIEKLALSLLKPKGFLAFTKWLILLFEWKNPAKVIQVFYKYKKKYISVAQEHL